MVYQLINSLCLICQEEYLSFGLIPKMIRVQPASGNAANLYTKNTIAYNIEGGVKIFVSEKVSLNISASQYFPQTDYLDDVAAAYSNDSYTTF